MDEEKKCLKTNEFIITLALLLAFIGVLLILHPYLLSKKNIAYEEIGFQIYENDVLNKLDNITTEGDNPPSVTLPEDKEQENKDDIKKPDNDKDNIVIKPQNNYIGTIEINKIGLKKGFVSPDSKYNNIEYNVTILKGFNYPDVKDGNFILAAHSGTGPKAHFKNLYKLKNGDIVTITYKNKKYTYKIVKIYTQKKQGYLTIYRDVKKTTLTLITCTKGDKTSQTVYIAELI